MPTLADLEARGFVIGTVCVYARNVFDTNDPLERHALFRLANYLHIQTRPSIIKQSLLFKTGDRLVLRQIEETERLLRTRRYLYDVEIRPAAVRDGVVDIDVLTRDTWSLDPGIGASRSGGSNTTSFGASDFNFLGTGTTVGLGRRSGVDRAGTTVDLANDRLFGSWVHGRLSHTVNDDGRRDELALVRPFHALDGRWAAGLTAWRFDRAESVYDGGIVVDRYRHAETRGEVFAGMSSGLVNGWVERWSVGITGQSERYGRDVAGQASLVLPADEHLAAPFLRYELIEDRFGREFNRNQVGRPEFFALGLRTSLQLGRAMKAMGSSTDAWLYKASVSRGLDAGLGHISLASADIDGRWQAGQVQREKLSLQASTFMPHHRRWVFYAAVSVDMITRPALGEELLLGGDSGLRGYPLRYQTGQRRALLTVEERYFTDLFIARLFRVGAAGFVDVGRAGGGLASASSGSAQRGWLADAGLGLRIASTRAAFGNVMHVDLATPINPEPGIDRVQLLVKSKLSF